MQRAVVEYKGLKNSRWSTLVLMLPFHLGIISTLSIYFLKNHCCSCKVPGSLFSQEHEVCNYKYLTILASIHPLQSTETRKLVAGLELSRLIPNSPPHFPHSKSRMYWPVRLYLYNSGIFGYFCWGERANWCLGVFSGRQTMLANCEQKRSQGWVPGWNKK